MSLSTKLSWKLLPDYNIRFTASAFNSTGSPRLLNNPVDVLNGIYEIFTSTIYADGTARITGSGGTGWSFFKSGSLSVVNNVSQNPNVVYGYPPTLTALSQSIIFMGGDPGLNSQLISFADRQFQLGGFVQFGGTASYSQSAIYAGHSIRSSNYKYFNITNPMETGSNVPLNSISSSFSGFYRMETHNSVSKNLAKIKIWECNEAIIVQFIMSNQNVHSAFIAGAIIDPESDSLGEVDGRIYASCGTNGMQLVPSMWMGSVTSSVTSANTTLAAYNFAQNRFLSTTPGPLHSKMSYFVPNSIQISYLSLMTDSYTNNFTNTSVSGSVPFGINLVDDNGNVVRMPIFYKNYYTGRWVGRLREIQTFKDSYNGTIIKSAGTTIGSIFSSSDRVPFTSVFLIA